MDKEGKQGKIREKALAGVDATRWYPSWGKNRIYAMIENRPDWCISRQRSWGVPIPIFYCEKCGEPQMAAEFFDAVISAVRKDGTNVWFTKSAAELLPKTAKCSCGGHTFKKESDIMDVWFESGASQKSVLKNNPALSWPADLYLEGSDQHRGWFHSSMLLSVGENGVAPYRNVLTHGFTIDDKGRKMSKSLGNVVDALKTIDQHGADVLRLWVASTDFKNDLAVSPAIIKQVEDAFSKIRNTWRFLLSNLYDYQEMKDLLPLDRWILSRFQKLVAEVHDAYENFEFHKIYHGVHNFCANDLSAGYLDMQKDNLYCNAPNSRERRSCQYALKVMLVTMVKLMAPIMSFTCEDIYTHIKAVVPTETLSFVLLADMPTVDQTLVNEELEKKYENLLKIKDDVYKALEIQRAQKVISSSAEASVLVPRSATTFPGFDLKELEALCIVSQMQLHDGAAVVVEKAKGDKCIRCWKYYETLTSEHICERCAGAVH
jgi:isoleucyl-tRNA synthetase